MTFLIESLASERGLMTFFLLRAETVFSGVARASRKLLDSDKTFLVEEVVVLFFDLIVEVLLLPLTS